MEIEGTIKENSWIMYLLPALVALYIYGEGKVLSYEVPPLVIYALLGLIAWVFSLLKKDLLAEKSKKPDVVYRDNQEMASQSPFDLEMRK